MVLLTAPASSPTALATSGANEASAMASDIRPSACRRGAAGAAATPPRRRDAPRRPAPRRRRPHLVQDRPVDGRVDDRMPGRPQGRRPVPAQHAGGDQPVDDTIPASPHVTAEAIADPPALA